MADYKDLIASLRQHGRAVSDCERCMCYDEAESGLKTCSEMLAEKAADAIEELLADAPKWISVADRLPTGDEGDWVLGIANGEYDSVRLNDALELVEYDAGTENWFLHEAPHAEVAVTHWMPLPEPPEGVIANGEV